MLFKMLYHNDIGLYFSPIFNGYLVIPVSVTVKQSTMEHVTTFAVSSVINQALVLVNTG